LKTTVVGKTYQVVFFRAADTKWEKEITTIIGQAPSATTRPATTEVADHSASSHGVSVPTTESTEISKQAIKPPASVQPAIPSDVLCSMITTDEVPGNGRRLQIRINKIVSKDVLGAIAKTLKATEPHPFRRTFILYYLPGMTPGHGAWATTNFDPDLDIEILGLTVEQAAALATPPPPNQEIIGRWIDNFPGSSCEITIYRANGKLLMERKFQDGSGGETPLIERQSPLGREFEDADS
jgi:hypothetical protein